ncbi:MAG: hypothetical protein AAGF81_10715 [Pseudomonadota bacterium]
MDPQPQTPDPAAWPEVALRPAEHVMRLDRMGSFFASRLSFMRALTRIMARESWQFECPVNALDEEGYGHMVLRAVAPDAVFSLVIVTEHLEPEERTDRVIAEKWDASFALVDGDATNDDIERLKNNIPYQEAGRYTARELVLSRANKSMRLFHHVVSELAEGRQPELAELMATGYLMRTTAVYGNGKFGLADFPKASSHSALAGAFRAEMLTVYLIRQFSFLLVNHVAKAKGAERAVDLAPDRCRALGIGNSTGLGMAPFLIKHPILIHCWVHARETALARVRAVQRAEPQELEHFSALLRRAKAHVDQWNVDDDIQMDRILVLRGELEGLLAEHGAGDLLRAEQPWDHVYCRVEMDMSLEAQELMVSLLIELYPERVDDLAEQMATSLKEQSEPAKPIGKLKAVLNTQYEWALSTDFADPQERHYFWYYSEGKEEPRRGPRFEEFGAGLEMRLGFGYQVHRLAAELQRWDDETSIAEFLFKRPKWRSTVRRIQTLQHYPYGEIRDNLLGLSCRPIDLLRCKLSFFGATGFDPRSDLWTRITMYQGAPLPDELSDPGSDDWAFPAPPIGR